MLHKEGVIEVWGGVLCLCLFSPCSLAFLCRYPFAVPLGRRLNRWLQLLGVAGRPNGVIVWRLVGLVLVFSPTEQHS